MSLDIGKFLESKCKVPKENRTESESLVFQQCIYILNDRFEDDGEYFNEFCNDCNKYENMMSIELCYALDPDFENADQFNICKRMFS